jgi:ATP-dependent Clp protease adaptor protein ClpS
MDPYEVLREHRRDWVLDLGERAASVASSNCEYWMDWYEMMKTIAGPLSQKQDPSRFEPFDKPGLGLLEKNEVKVKRPSMWNIVFYNDDYTPMDFVEFIIKAVFHMSTLDALALTLAVHTQGRGIAGTYTFEVAEQKQSEVLLMAKIEEHPLRVEVERV